MSARAERRLAVPECAAAYERLRLEPLSPVELLRAIGLGAAEHLPDLYELGLIGFGPDGRLRAVERRQPSDGG